MATNFRSFTNGLRLVPKVTSTANRAGELDFDTTANKFNAHNGSSSSPLVTESHTATLINKSMSGSSNTFTNIPYGALVLTGSIVNADISPTAAIAYSKLNLTGSIVNADVSGSAAIAYSKLNLAGSIVNADISASAAIAYSKLAALTINRALVSDGSGVVSVSAVTSTELGYLSGVTSAIQTQLTGKANTTLNNLGSTAVNVNIVPDANAAWALGTPSLNWSSVRSREIASDISLDVTASAISRVSINGAVIRLNAQSATDIVTPTPSASDLYYNTGSKQFKYYNGTSWKAIGGGSFVTSANQNISAAGTIIISADDGFQMLRVTGNAAAVSASTTPFGASPPTDGTILQVIGQSDTNTVKLTHNDASNGCWLNGDVTLGKYQSITLQYDSTAARYIEIARSY